MSTERFFRRSVHHQTVHRQRPTDTSASFVHALCGLTFTQPATVHPDGVEMLVMCAECEVAESHERREQYVDHSVCEFRPGTGQVPVVAVPYGPPTDVDMVDVVVAVDDDGEVRTSVFMGGREVPVTRLRQHVIDSVHGYIASSWTGGDSGDVTVPSPVAELIESECVSHLAAGVDLVHRD